MGVKLLENIRKATGLRNYGIHKAIQAMGCKITLQGLDGYDRPEAKSIRIDVQKCLKQLCEDHGIPREKFEKWIDADAEAIMK